MDEQSENWEARIAAAWAAADELDENDVVAVIDALVSERAADDPSAVFEAASVRDYVGLEHEAEPLYRRALELGLEDPRRPQAVIQLASTLRNLGKHDEAIDLLRGRLAEFPDDEWSGPAAAFLALALASSGDDKAAASVALTALADYLPAYGNSVRSYAEELVLDSDD
jgi:tetratricopeptide (TPR) repeat protein